MSDSSTRRGTPPQPRSTTVVVRFGAVVVLLLLAVVITKIVTGAGANADSDSLSSPETVVSSTLKVGDEVPKTGALNELDGARHATIAALADHRPMVINFFGSYCTACAAEMKNFAQVSNGQHGVQFIGVDTDEPSLSDARKLLEKAGVTYPILEDTNGTVLAAPYGVAELPATFYVTGSGKIIAEVLGFESASELRAHLASL